ncbi:unnamed protein product [Amoebophrya sp. A120]|nr:unnamed protein product [Amoebophrya sp. A120]|eukprot:GSA120T00016721001.1
MPEGQVARLLQEVFQLGDVHRSSHGGADVEAGHEDHCATCLHSTTPHLPRMERDINHSTRSSYRTSFTTTRTLTISSSEPPAVVDVDVDSASSARRFSTRSSPRLLSRSATTTVTARKHQTSFFPLVQLIQYWIFPPKSKGVLKENQLCPNAVCRNTVAQLGGGGDSVKYVIDAGGVKWKCGTKDMLHGEMRGTDGWACVELDCRNEAHGTIVKSFHGDSNDCGEPLVITNVDGMEAEGAPKNAREYEPVESALDHTCVDE